MTENIVLLALAAGAFYLLQKKPSKTTWTIPARGYPYRATFEKIERRYKLPKNILSVIAQIESNYDARAVGADGEQGIMQIYPRFHPDPNITKQTKIDWLNAPLSIDYAGSYLSYLHKKTGNWRDAVRAYNGGIGNVLREQKNQKLLTKRPDFWRANVNKYAAKVAKAVDFSAPQFWS